MGSPVYPNKVPFNNTLVISLLINKLNLFKGIIPISNKHFLILSTFNPAVILVNNDKFLRYPIEAPSGLSNGHIIPHCCECNLCGLVILTLLSIGILTLLKCDKYPI